MTGFDFRYRLNGAPPTVETVPLHDSSTVAERDMVSFLDGRLAVGASRGPLLGVALGTHLGAGSALVKVITDRDAVYGVIDGTARAIGASLSLTGATGGQTVSASDGPDLTVVTASTDIEETLVRIAVGRHAYDHLTAGQLNAALARVAVRIQHEYVGRGPTKAQAFFHHNIVVVLLEDVMTQAERTLAARGRSEVVLDMRRQFQRAMRDALVDAVEHLTGATVVSFMSDGHLEPDMAVEIFVLDRSAGSQPGRSEHPDDPGS